MPNECKGVIVGGVPRSGKTTLSRRLAKELSLNHISLDAVVHAFEEAFPALGITHDARDYNQLCEALKPFVLAYVRSLSRFGIRFILEGYYLRPQDFKDEGFDLVFLGYPSADPQQMLTRLRALERDTDWTRSFADDVVLSDLQGFVRASSRIRSWCEEMGVLFVDVSSDAEAKLEETFRRFI
jgi:hypothetical protein